jgi:biopolymer transport protein ExbD
MSDIEVADKGDGKKRSKKLSTKVDMTPMVDLGFLLITFFMLATTLSKPQAMELNVPAKTDDTLDQTIVKESKALTLILASNDTLYYYIGIEEPEVGFVDFSQSKNVEPIIYDRQKKVQEQWGDKDELVVVIKAMAASKYKNLVNILDEMSITQTKRYAIGEFTEVDSMIIYDIIQEEQ